MFCLIQFYLSISDKIKEYKPLLQLFSIKAIIFLMFWQSSFLSALHSFNVIKDTKYMNAEDINTGLAALLQTFEMVLFAFLHVRCFSYIPYRKDNRSQMTPKGKALAHALDFRDFWWETRDGLVYMWRKMRGKEAELEARRRTHFERAIGKSRIVTETKKGPVEPHGAANDDSDEGDVEFSSSFLLGTREEQPWILEKEKAAKKKRERNNLDGKPNFLPDFLDEERGHEPRQRSWWSRMYGRLSTEDAELEPPLPPQKRQPSGGPSNIPIRASRSHVKEYALRPVNLDEPPPSSLLARGKRSGHRESDDPSNEKQPFLNWSPSVTLLPRSTDKGLRVDQITSPSDQPHAGELGEKSGRLERGDSLLGRIFAHTPEHSADEGTTEQEKKHHGLPSLFQKKHEIASSVKGWGIPSSKSSPTPPPVPVKEEDILSIPSLSPSPPGRANPTQLINILNRTSPPVPTPAQPVPVLHDSLSRARRPGVLIADEAGISPPRDLIQVPPPPQLQPQPKPRIEQWIESTSKRLENPPIPPLSMRPSNHRPMDSYGGMPPPVNSMRDRSYAPRGPKRPAKIVLPTPLSPARWPGGPPQQSMTMPLGAPMPNAYQPPMSRLPPGASHGPAPVQNWELGFKLPSQLYATVSKSRGPAPRPPDTYQFNPYEQFGAPAFEAPRPPVSNERSSRTQRREQRQPVRQEPVSGAEVKSSRRSRERSPFGITPPVSDAESLPRHPAMRQQTARTRRQSQPLPTIPPGAAPPVKPKPGPAGAKRPRRRSEPLRASYNADMSSSPPLSPALLTSPTSPTSPLGDTRYPRATSREAYFDEYDTVSPYLTTIMNDAIHPPPTTTVGGGENASIASGSASPARRTKRR